MVQIKITSALVLAAIVASNTQSTLAAPVSSLVERAPPRPPAAPQVVVDVINGKAKREPAPPRPPPGAPQVVVDVINNKVKAKREPAPQRPAPQVIVDVINKKAKREPAPQRPAPQVIVDVINKKAKREPAPPRPAPAPQVVVDVINNKAAKVKREPKGRTDSVIQAAGAVAHAVQAFKGKREPEPEPLKVPQFVKSLLGREEELGLDTEVREVEDVLEFEERFFEFDDDEM